MAETACAAGVRSLFTTITAVFSAFFRFFSSEAAILRRKQAFSTPRLSRTSAEHAGWAASRTGAGELSLEVAQLAVDRFQAFGAEVFGLADVAVDPSLTTLNRPVSTCCVRQPCDRS
jgi:hypothetical protein